MRRHSARDRVMAALAALVLAAWPVLAKPKEKKVDLIWTHPAIDSLRVQSIALLPAVSYDHNRENERLVETLFARQLGPSGYRWVTPEVGRAQAKAALGENVRDILEGDILKGGRVDSLHARTLCGAVRAEAVLSTRLDQFEKVEIEWNQAGKSTTTVRLSAALVDSTGRLLWSASGIEVGEGQYHDPNAGTMGVKSTGLGSTPVTAEAKAPSFEEVTTRLLTRWITTFPARKVAAPAQP